MSPRSTTEVNAEQQSCGRFLRMLSVAAIALLAVALGGILLIDPYGVSPLQASIPRVNVLKPKRLDIDRTIKPYEVWRYRPKTVFLGTSRVHQAFDPGALDGTRFAPAYNASIPASPIAENAAHLRQYFEASGGSIKHVIVELFFYSFTPPQPAYPRKTLRRMAEDTLPLFASGTAAFDSLRTLAFNVAGRPPTATVLPDGRWTPTPGTPAHFGMQLNIDTIMAIHKNVPDMIVQPTAVEALKLIAELCRANGAELYMVVTPNYAWDDYRLLSLGYWHRVEEFMRAVAGHPNVYSFSQHNAVSEEPAGPVMRWWYDPTHFSVEAGRMILRLLAGLPVAEAPANMMRRVTPGNVAAITRERLDGLKRWADRNPGGYVTAFEGAKVATGNDRKRGP